jgi:hypothetical protein
MIPMQPELSRQLVTPPPNPTKSLFLGAVVVALATLILCISVLRVIEVVAPAKRAAPTGATAQDRVSGVGATSTGETSLISTSTISARSAELRGDVPASSAWSIATTATATMPTIIPNHAYDCGTPTVYASPYKGKLNVSIWNCKSYNIGAFEPPGDDEATNFILHNEGPGELTIGKRVVNGWTSIDAYLGKGAEARVVWDGARWNYTHVRP